MSTPPIQYSGPVISVEVPWETRRHLQLIYQKLSNHTQAFSLQNTAIKAIQKGGSAIVSGGSSGAAGATAGLIAGAGVQIAGQWPDQVISTVPVGSVSNHSGVTSYATQTGDNGAIVVLSDASPIAVSLSTQDPAWFCWIDNQGAGTATVTPATGTITYAGNPGASSMPIASGQTAVVAFDGTNWWAIVAATAAAGLPINNPTFTGTMTGPHYAANGSTPAIAAGAAAGSSPTISISGNDVRGTIEVTPGTSTTTGTLATVTFAVGYGTAPVVQLTSAGSLTNISLFYVGATAAGFTISTGTSPTTANTLSFYYMVMG